MADHLAIKKTRGIMIMLIIGEKINTTKKSINAAVEAKDVEAIIKEAKDQLDAGANVIDVNTGTRIKSEVEDMKWLVNTIQGAIDCRLCIDSPDPNAIKAGLELCKQKPIVNSITGEKDRVDAIMPMVKKFGASVVALTMDEVGMPTTGKDRHRIATKIIEMIADYNIPIDDIYFDALIQPIGSNPDQGIEVLKGIWLIRDSFPDAHIVCGLSNISYGLPERKLLNRTFLPMAMSAGLDAAIMDPTDKKIMTTVLASSAILAQDEYCLNYISSWREGKLEA